MDVWAASTLWLLWIMLLWARVHKYICLSPCFQFLGYIPWSGIAKSYENWLLNFLTTPKLFFIVAASFYILTHSVQVFQCLHILVTTWYFLLMVAILVGMRQFFMCFWFVVLYWLDGRESEWTPRVGDGQRGLACCDSWGRKESDTTERLNWTELTEWLEILSIFFMCFLAICIYFWRNIYSALWPVFKLNYWLSFCWIILYIFWVLATYQIYSLQLFPTLS